MAQPKSLDDYPDILDAAMVAEILGMNLDYVRKLSRDGRIPAHKLPQGRMFRYFKDEIVDWLRALPPQDASKDKEEQKRAG